MTESEGMPDQTSARPGAHVYSPAEVEELHAHGAVVEVVDGVPMVFHAGTNNMVSPLTVSAWLRPTPHSDNNASHAAANNPRAAARKLQDAPASDQEHDDRQRRLQAEKVMFEGESDPAAMLWNYGIEPSEHGPRWMNTKLPMAKVILDRIAKAQARHPLTGQFVPDAVPAPGWESTNPVPTPAAPARGFFGVNLMTGPQGLGRGSGPGTLDLRDQGVNVAQFHRPVIESGHEAQAPGDTGSTPSGPAVPQPNTVSAVAFDRPDLGLQGGRQATPPESE